MIALLGLQLQDQFKEIFFSNRNNEISKFLCENQGEGVKSLEKS